MTATTGSTASDVLKALVRLPTDLRTRGVSVRTLMLESGYLAVPDLISVKGIEKVLLESPDRVTEWLHYSEDKRVSSGWYLRKAEEEWEVGYYSGPEGFKEVTFYGSGEEACAVFIKREFESMRRLVRMKEHV